MATGLSDTNTNITNAADAANTQLNTVQTNVLDGQRGLGTNLDTLTSNVDAYSTQSLENQDTLQKGQDTFKSSFDDYVGRYGTDTDLANQTRADLQTAQANATDRIREDMGTYAQAAAGGTQALSDQVTKTADTNMSALEGGFAQQQANDVDMSQAMTREFVTQARDVANLAADTEGLSMDMRQNFKTLGSAFDDNGDLISSSIDEQGNTLTRQIDQNGMLMLRSFDATGKSIGSRFIDINQSLNQLGQLQQQSTQNVAAGSLTPATQQGAVQGGLMASQQ